MSDKWRNPPGSFLNPDSFEGETGEISEETRKLISDIIPFISSPQELILMKKDDIDVALNGVKIIVRSANIMAIKCAVIMKDMEKGIIEDDGITYTKDEETGNCSASQYIGCFNGIAFTDPRQSNLVVGLVKDAFAKRGYYVPNYPADVCTSKEDAYGVFDITCKKVDKISIAPFHVYIMLKNKK